MSTWSVPATEKSERKGTDTGTVGPFPAEPMVRILVPFKAVIGWSAL
jgi:hypothetical protein